MLTTVLLKQKRFEEAMTEGKKALASGGETVWSSALSVAPPWVWGAMKRPWQNLTGD
jgi:hypothetical protein